MPIGTVLAVGAPPLVAITALIVYAFVRNAKERRLGNPPWQGSIRFYLVMMGIMLEMAVAIVVAAPDVLTRK